MSSFRSSDSGVTISSQQQQRRAFQDKPVACSYADCQHRFDSVEDMITHKVREPDHFYCKKCKVDCHDWEDLLAHKVDMMTPFIEKDMKGGDERPKHIVCELCGIDFKSMGGRKTHRRQAHPADQDVLCPGCPCIFPRASNMIEHLEQGRCPRITKQEFHTHIQQKHMLSQIMTAPGSFQEAIERNQQQLLPAMDRLSVKSGHLEESGVSLLEEYDEAQQSGYKPLQPDRPLVDLQSHSSEAAWPILSSAEPSIDRGSSQAGTQSIVSSAWTTGKTAKALFKVAETEPPAAGEWEAIAKHCREQQDDTNLLKAHFWDNEALFWNNSLHCYICPFPACQQDTRSYEALDEIRQHIELVHLRSMYRCDGCFKRFNWCAALVGHIESTNKCGMRDSNGFKKFVNEITGGFLKADRISEPKIYRSGVVKHGEKPLNGIASTRFTGKAPHED